MDLHEISALLHIEEKTREHPSLVNIHNAAMSQLKVANEEHAKQAAQAAEEEKAKQLAKEEEEAKEREKEQAEKEQAEKEKANVVA
jgi:hypothetical protein